MLRSCLDVSGVTGSEGSDIEGNKAHWSFHGDDEQSLTRETHGVAHRLVYEHDGVDSMRWTTEQRAQSMSMGIMEK